MTVSSSNNRVQYTGNDSATEFDYTFKIFEASDLTVILTDANDVETTLVRGTDYSVSGAGNDGGGKVTYPLSGDPLATGETLTILREIPIVQETDLRNQAAYYPETVEDELDRSRMIDQQQEETLGRALKKTKGGDDFDAGGARIENLGDAVELGDAASRGYMEGYFKKLESGELGDTSLVTAEGTADQRNLAAWTKALGYPTTSTGTDQPLAEALDRRVIHVASLSDLQNLPSASLTEGQHASVKDLGDYIWLSGAWRKQAGSVFADVASLKATTLPPGSVAETDVYSATTQSGGGRYRIKTLDEHRTDISDTLWVPDEIFDHTLTNGNVAILEYNDGINLTQGGLPTIAQDANSDVEPFFNAAQTKIVDELGAGRIIIGDPGNVYGYKESMLVTNDMVVDFRGEIRCTGDTTYDAAILGVAGADGYQILNPVIDCNNQPAEGGVYFRRNNTNAKAINITVMNAAHDKTTKGGRALMIEAGVNPTENGNRNAIVDKITAKNCFSAVAIAGGDSTKQTPNTLVGTVIAENCEHLIQLFANDGTYPPNGEAMSGIIETVIARNCGKQTTYTVQTGAIVSDRGGNVIIDSLVLVNDATYGSINSLVYGDYYNVHLKSAVFMGDCTRIAHFARFFEADSITDDLFYTGKSSFDIKQVGTCSTMVISSLSADSKVVDTELKIVSDTVSGGNVLPSQMTAKTSVYCDFRETANNSRVIGIAKKIGGSVLFSDFPDAELEMGRKLRLPTFSDNAAAKTGGLSVGDTYAVTSSDPRQVAVVF